MNDQSFEYYRNRAMQERAAADQATDERAAECHREMADHYDKLAAAMDQPAARAEPPSSAIATNGLRVIP